MREKDIVQTVTIKHQAVGTEATKAAVNSVTDAVKGLGDAAQTTGAKQEQATRRQASAAAAFEQLERRVNPAARALADYERAQRLVGRAVDQNAALQERGNAILQTYRDRVAAAGAAHGELGKGAGLARHELINLSRQAQDVAVSLGSGQGFGTVLLQQGSQILDVLGTSQGGIRGSLVSLGTSLRGLVTVGRVAFAGIAAGAAGAAFALSDYLSQQKDLERGLIGSRTASPGGINAIAGDRSSLTGLSVSEAREAALEFAKTGQIHSRVIGGMIETTKNFALVTGQSSKEAAAALAGAFTNIQGVDKLNQQFNFLDGNTRRVVESLLLAGRTTEAAALTNERLAVALKGVEDTQGLAAKGWTAIGNAVSDATGKLGEFIAKYSGLQGSSKMDRAVQLDELVGRLEGQGGGGKYFEATLEKYRSELAAIRQELSGEHWGKAFNALSASASQAVAATDPLRGKLDAVVGTLTRLQDAQRAGINIPGLQMALSYYQQIADQIQRQMQAQDALMAKYPGMTAEFAKQVEALKDQNELLKARQNGNEASVAAGIAYKNAIAGGANETEAAAIKAETLKGRMLQARDAAASISLDNLNAGLDQAVETWDAFESRMRSRAQNGFTREFKTDGKQYESEIDPWSGFKSFVNSIVSGDPLSHVITQNPAAFPLPTETFKKLSDFRKQQMESFTSGQIQFLGGSSSKEDKIAGMELQIQSLQAGMRQNPGNYWQVLGLQRAISELKNSVDENTEALNKVTLNPLYTEGRSALRLGYMGAAKGMDFTVQGGVPGIDSVPIHIMAQQGERVQVTPAGQTSNDNSRTIVQNNVFNFGDSKSARRRSDRQAGQRYAQMMAANS